ncbi:Fat storage-inducing transmembrane protein [Syncephalis fuscata]|nr:Fat storage-inducing transmembrane protein [Syncephalis fuscata]
MTSAATLADRHYPQGMSIAVVYVLTIGWFWTTAVFFVWAWFVLLLRRPRPQLQLSGSEQPSIVVVTESEDNGALTPEQAKQIKVKIEAENVQRFSAAVLRWLLSTVYWWLITQWMVGPSLSDRVYRWSGGQCYPVDMNGQLVLSNDATANQLVENDGEISQPFDLMDLYTTSVTCRQAGGRWHGGHDISGHIMLLIHASLFLHSELSGLRAAAIHSTAIHPRMARRATRGIRYLLALWWWMLLMSSVYAFHPLSEKISGLIMGVLYWTVMYVYILPRISLPGMPGQV